MCQRGKRLKITRQYIAGVFDGEGSIGIYLYYGERYVLRTQFTQNKYPESVRLIRSLKRRYGGSFSPQRSRSGKIKFNWQLNGLFAARFLQDIVDCLILKKRQAKLAIRWQLRRPLPSRRLNGTFRKYPNTKRDQATAKRLKEMK